MAQLVEFLTLDFGSGHDPRAVGSSPMSGSALSREPAEDSLSPSLSLPLPPSYSLSRSNNNNNNSPIAPLGEIEHSVY